MKKIKWINHPADLGFVVYGKNIEELFTNAAWVMLNIITPLNKVSKKTTTKINLKANNPEELLIIWLNELLYYYNVKKIIFNEFELKKINKTYLCAYAQGEKINLSRHTINTEIKAATYHQLKITHFPKHKPYPWQAQIIFDV